jgi:hypothetical protein
MRLIHGRAPHTQTFILGMGVHLSYGRASQLWVCISDMGMHLIGVYLAGILSSKCQGMGRRTCVLIQSMEEKAAYIYPGSGALAGMLAEHETRL